MGSPRGLLLIVIAVCAATLVGSALAANSGGFRDPEGDTAVLAPDVTAVSISTDDAGTITATISLAAGGAGAVLGEVALAIDADQNPDTGTYYYGAEFALSLDRMQPTFYRAAASGDFETAPAPASFRARFDPGQVTFVVKASDLGIAPTAGFNVAAVGVGIGLADTAPDIRTFNYEQVAGTAAVVPGADARAPFDHAEKSTGVHGKRAELVFSASDGRGETAETFVIYRGKKVLKTIRLPLADTNPFFSYSVTWRVPKKVRGKLRFCVSSLDRAGNKSNVSCAPLTIK
jgi:hypothetical protein